MITVFENSIRPIPFVELIDYSTGKTKIRKVDINTETYEVAKNYMIRLEPEDFQGENLDRLAKVAKMEPEQFKARFEYLVLDSKAC
jgi:6-phosphofructokinase 1